VQYTSNVPTDVNGYTDSVGVYTSTWTATNPAGNTASFTQVVIVSAPPVARMVIIPVNLYYKYNFIDTSLNYPTNRVWYWGDGTSNNLNQKHATKVYTTAGLKCVILKVWNQYGTDYDTSCIQTYKAGINDVEVSNKINVFPNPSSGVMTVEMAADIAQGAKVTVVSILGEDVSAPIEIKAGVTSQVLDLRYLDAGAYMLRIETTSGTAIKTIAINK
jgi:PKD repeat protein